MRKKDQESQQPVAEIPPTNPMWGIRILLSTRAQNPKYRQTAWKGRIAARMSLKQTSSK